MRFREHLSLRSQFHNFTRGRAGESSEFFRIAKLGYREIHGTVREEEEEATNFYGKLRAYGRNLREKGGEEKNG